MLRALDSIENNGYILSLPCDIANYFVYRFHPVSSAKGIIKSEVGDVVSYIYVVNYILFT